MTTLLDVYTSREHTVLMLKSWQRVKRATLASNSIAIKIIGAIAMWCIGVIVNHHEALAARAVAGLDHRT